MTESIMAASKTIFRQPETEGCILTFTNNASAALNVGQEVFVSGNMLVNKRTTAAQFPIGVITQGGADTEKVSVFTCFQRTIRAVAKGGTINAGAFVIPNGTYNAVGLPEYVAATGPVISNGVTTSVLGDYASGVVLKGGNVDTEIEIGFFRMPIILRGTVSV